ncbi:sensor histidine kinase [Thomasclavelia spiroformis]|uniref:sensor histidine kinase n=1 Tax=Thomasclavelia spiroformis TaxID=29348 RepID=UPI00255B8C93|nr:GHKL domain-containing protein [Thomasclavelia spiroformis]
MTLLNAFSEFFFFMLYYKTTKKEKSKLLLLIFGFAVSCLHSFVLYPFYYRYHLGPLSFSTIISITLNCCTIILLERRNIKEIIMRVTILYLFFIMISMPIALIFTSIWQCICIIFNISTQILSIGITLSNAVGFIVYYYVMLWIYKKFELENVMQNILKKYYKTWKVICFEAAVFFLICGMEISQSVDLNTIAINILTYVFMYIGVISFTRRVRLQQLQKESEELKNMIVEQQNMYINELEDIQKQMRIFRHDYQNQMSSLYLSSQEGDIENVEKSLKTMINDFDEHIGKKMNITNQLANIQIPEVKSLLMKKMTEIQKFDISIKLEVLYPFSKINMPVFDFIRCLGILIDNAMEEVKENNGYIHLVLLASSSSQLTMTISNTIHREIDCKKIFQEGYSTKGENRGMGLNILQEIIHQNENITMETRVENNEFIQELIIC